MTKVMEPADKHQEGEIVPKGGERYPILLLFAPVGDGRESMSSIRRFHSLRSFHPRLFTFAPFGDGRIPLMKVQNDGKAFVLSGLEMRQNCCEKINCM